MTDRDDRPTPPDPWRRNRERENAELRRTIHQPPRLARPARPEPTIAVDSYPPRVVERPARSLSPVPDSHAKSDQVLGAAVRTFAVRLAAKAGFSPLLLALGLGSGAVAVLRPAATPQKVDAAATRIEALETKLAALSESHAAVLKREALKDQLVECLQEQYGERFAQLLPAKDRLGSAALPQPWFDRCAHFRPKK